MAPFTNLPLSPAELSYLHTSLAQTPPLRPDGRSPTQFRPLVAETDILPSANGSARICFADGTEAVVGVKAEVERTKQYNQHVSGEVGAEGVLGLGKGSEADVLDVEDDAEDEQEGPGGRGKGRDAWLEVAIEIPGMRDDDALPVFLSAMLTEALLADGGLKDRLYMNRRFHWRLYIDILLLSQPLSYPLPLLSLTTHLALLSARLPALVSEKDEDPLFNDDWEASTFLYPRHTTKASSSSSNASKPPITLLVMSVGENTILFDPSREELAVADAVLAISVAATLSTEGEGEQLRVVAMRSVDPPSRLTAAGGVSAADGKEQSQGQQGVWRPPRGGVGRGVVKRMVQMVVEEGGVGWEVLEGLRAVEM